MIPSAKNQSMKATAPCPVRFSGTVGGRACQTCQIRKEAPETRRLSIRIVRMRT
jgi:hypothetical protein